MYDTLLSVRNEDELNNPFTEAVAPNIKYIAHTNWEEHCVECSPPYCYHHCSNYIARADHRCVRLLNGIQAICSINGPLGYGIKCEFRKWAKLETIFTGSPTSIKKEKRADTLYRSLGKICVGVSKITKTTHLKYSPYSLIDSVRRHLFLRKRSISQPIYDYFIIDCFLEDKNQVSLLIQMDKEEILYSKIHTIKKGQNILKIPIKEIVQPGIRIFLTPLEETNTIIYFRWLDFIKENENFSESIHSDTPEAKVKVVAWDLDNTLWEGTLVNNRNVKLNETAIAVIKELDKRGILNTICSKNDMGDAISKLQEFGIADYFLYPAINWGQKSENLKSIAQHLNLGINSFAFIDDNVREREEVAQALPCVRIFSENDIVNLLELNEFNVPVTETSKKRRQLYIEDSKRNKLKEVFSDNYDDFLRSLEMRLKVEQINDDNKNRCYELLSRSNQLNLSTNRYTTDEYDRLINNPNNVCFAFRVSDKFGDYGIVSFLSLNIDGNTARIIDFVISCRIAKKKVEATIIRSLKGLLLLQGVERISANLIVTKKNGPLVSVFNDLPFNKIEEDSQHILYVLDNLVNITDDNIIEIVL